MLLLVLNTSAMATPEKTTVTKNLRATPPDSQQGMLGCPAEADSISWICQDINQDTCGTFCSTLIPNLKSNSMNWAPFGQRVDHCLVNRADQQCTLKFSLPIMAIVILMNVVKATMMCIVGLVLQAVPIVTLGDAIESFLAQPDVSAPPSISRVAGTLPRAKRCLRNDVSHRRWWACILV